MSAAKGKPEPAGSRAECLHADVTVSRWTYWILAFAAFNIVVVDFIAPRVQSEEFFLRTSSAWVKWTADLVGSPGQRDSWAWMLLAQERLAADAADPLYDALFFGERVKFQYPPSSVLVLRAVGVEPGAETEGAIVRLNRIGWLFVLVNLAAVVLLLFVLWRKRIDPARGPPPWLVGAVAALAVTYFPVIDAYRLGQIQTWLNAFLALAFLAWVLGREWIAGAIVGLMCLVKPHYGVIYLWALLRRRVGFAVAATVTGAGGLLMSIALYGLDNHFNYLRAASFMSRRGETYFPNQSTNGLLNRLISQDPAEIMRFTRNFPDFHPVVYGGSMLVALLLVGGCLFWRFRARIEADAIAFSIPAITATIASPIAWEHHYGALLPVFVLIFVWCLERPGERAQPLAVLGGCWLLMAHPFLMRGAPGGYAILDRIAATPLNLGFSYMFAAALALLGLAYLVQERSIPTEQP